MSGDEALRAAVRRAAASGALANASSTIVASLQPAISSYAAVEAAESSALQPIVAAQGDQILQTIRDLQPA